MPSSPRPRGTHLYLHKGGRITCCDKGGTRTPGKDGAPQPEGVARNPGVELAVGDFGDDPGRQDFVLGLTLSGSGDSGVGGSVGGSPCDRGSSWISSGRQE